MVFTESDYERDFLPVLVKVAKKVFRGKREREELVCDTISEGWRMLQTAPPTATPRSIAMYAINHVKVERHFAASERSITGPNPRRKAKAQRTEFDVGEIGKVYDNPAKLAALRVDFPAWVLTLTHRQQLVLLAVLRGDSTSEIAERFKITPGAVSQIRAKLVQRWHAFHS